MTKYVFTYIHKEYFDVEIEATCTSEAREKFNAIVLEDKIDWQNPDYIDSESYHEEVKNDEVLL